MPSGTRTRPSATVDAFVNAMAADDEALALSLISSGRVAPRALVKFGSGAALPLLHYAAAFSNKPVYRKLVERGADAHDFRSIPTPFLIDNTDASFTALGFAVYFDYPDMLLLAADLGASTTSAMKMHATVSDPTDVIFTAVAMAIYYGRRKCLVALLDVVLPARPVELEGWGLLRLGRAAGSGGKDAIKTCKILAARGFDFKSLKKTEFSSDDGGKFENFSPGTTAADYLICNARMSGSAALVQYLVKVLGVECSGGRMDVMGAALAEVCAPGHRPKEVDLARFKCQSCDKVGATFFCSSCKVPRYCSKPCQRSHWKEGGHKNDCKEMTRRAAISGAGTESGAS